MSKKYINGILGLILLSTFIDAMEKSDTPAKLVDLTAYAIVEDLEFHQNELTNKLLRLNEQCIEKGFSELLCMQLLQSRWNIINLLPRARLYSLTKKQIQKISEIVQAVDKKDIEIVTNDQSMSCSLKISNAIVVGEKQSEFVINKTQSVIIRNIDMPIKYKELLNKAILRRFFILKDKKLKYLCIDKYPCVFDSIKRLDLFGSHLIDIPDNIGIILPNLDYINLGNNKIEKIPNSLMALRRLEFLDFSWNCLHEIPHIIHIGESITELNLKGNKIRSFPQQSLQKMVHLKSLHLAFNKLINWEILSSRSLINLDVSHNRITAIPNLSNLKQLRKLIACDNKIISIDKSLIDVFENKEGGYIELTGNTFIEMAQDTYLELEDKKYLSDQLAARLYPQFESQSNQHFYRYAVARALNLAYV